MKAKLLLDSHVPYDVSRAVRKLCPTADVHHISEWEFGAYVSAGDDLVLEACAQDNRTLVSQDRATLPDWIALRIAEGKNHGGVLFYDPERFKAPQIGSLAKAIATALEETNGRMRNRWITLR